MCLSVNLLVKRLIGDAKKVFLVIKKWNLNLPVLDNLKLSSFLALLQSLAIWDLQVFPFYDFQNKIWFKQMPIFCYQASPLFLNCFVLSHSVKPPLLNPSLYKYHVHSILTNVFFIPKKVKGDRDRRPFWAGGENKVARRLFEDLGGSWFSSTEWAYARNSATI